MQQDTKTAAKPRTRKPAKALNAIRNSQSYADIQHFYTSKLKYALAQEKEAENYVLGYN